MVLDLIIDNSGDGYSANIPSIKGCECWSHNEDEAISKSLELLSFYLSLPDDQEIIVDKARTTSHKTIYKLVFDK
ncbi:hypothetical protein ASZ90_004795 [hydrocarbon metagenome]|uniref:HicB-like antitoxin of toxin-antitoxin system domain-containing protein n=1 Tax=hydrocarbon metagenome TaxID=938273 RepID=A0A0W8FX58_9ZZZZ